MVNYEARIAMLQSKGVLNSKEAEKLSQILMKKSASVAMQRNYSLEIIALGIFTIFVIYIVMQVGFSDTSSEIENVAVTLNSARDGIGSIQSFGLLLIFAVMFVFVLFYFLVHRYYNKLWNSQKNMLAYGEMISDMQKRKEVLEQEIKSLLEKQLKDNNDAIKQAMEILERLSCELGDLESNYTMLKAQCRKDSKKFPYTLAAIVGPLPACDEKKE